MASMTSSSLVLTAFLSVGSSATCRAISWRKAIFRTVSSRTLRSRRWKSEISSSSVKKRVKSSSVSRSRSVGTPPPGPDTARAPYRPIVQFLRLENGGHRKASALSRARSLSARRDRSPQGPEDRHRLFRMGGDRFQDAPEILQEASHRGALEHERVVET